MRGFACSAVLAAVILHVCEVWLVLRSPPPSDYLKHWQPWYEVQVIIVLGIAIPILLLGLAYSLLIERRR